MKRCCRCQNTKSLEEFGTNRRNKDGKQKYCKVCSRETQREHYLKSPRRRKKIYESREQNKRRNQKIAVTYLLTNPCVDCGESDPMFLDFDHVREEKTFNVSSAVHWAYGESTLIEEIAKCDIRCVFCHRVKTAKDAGWYDSYLELVENLKNIPR